MDKSRAAAEIFNKHAKGYQDKFMDVSLYSKPLDFFCEHISKTNAEILELACGPGNVTKCLLNKRRDFKILGTDLSPNMIELARINNPYAEFRIMDCRDMGKLNKKFDAIMCSFCLPYLSMEECATLLCDASKLLNPNGLFYISTMEDDYEKSGLKKGSTGDEIFMHYYRAESLVRMLEENKLKILDLKRIDYPETDGVLTTDLVIISEK